MPLSLGSFPGNKVLPINFLIIDCPTSYNMILGRLSMNLFQAIVSTYHMKLNFLVNNLVGEVRGEQYSGRHCYSEALRLRGRIDVVDERPSASKRPRDSDMGQPKGKRPKDDPTEEVDTHVMTSEPLILVNIVRGQE